MAEANGNGSEHHGGSFGFLTNKIGPLPVWMWGAIIAGAIYWYTHYGPGANSSATGAKTGTSDIQTETIQREPAGGGSTYKTNAEWEDAALNYLVGESVPPDEASAALFNYLHSKALNTQEQKDVNLAIQGIGPPPKVPAPSETAPVPVGGPGGKPPGHGGKPPIPPPNPARPEPLPRHHHSKPPHTHPEPVPNPHFPPRPRKHPVPIRRG